MSVIPAGQVECPVCSRHVSVALINKHLDDGCPESAPILQTSPSAATPPVASFFIPNRKRTSPPPAILLTPTKAPVVSQAWETSTMFPRNDAGKMRKFVPVTHNGDEAPPSAKRQKTNQSSVNLRSAMPLAERMRPTSLSEVYGQELVGPNGVLRKMIEDQDRVPSMILWGGPGCGKTTCARIMAGMSKARFVELSGTTNGVQDCKKIFTEAKSELMLTGRKTILFIDEIHRFSKSQQDVFLAPVESGQVTLIGATTENPSFKVQAALLSRCRVFTLNPLSTEDTSKILRKALDSEFPPPHPSLPSVLDESFIKYLAEFASGDARTALNLLELAISLTCDPSSTLTQADLKKSLTRTLIYDRAGDAHYDTISAFIKSIRGSDANAALYYLGRMLSSGEDPLFITRRMVVFSSEDVGLADNSMLSLAMATHTAVQQIGLPEARINMAHCCVALAEAKKSTRAYSGLGAVMAAMEGEPEVAAASIPIHLRGAPTKLMKELGYGKDYKYPPDYVDGKVKQDYLPEKLSGRRFLEDNDLGSKIDEDF